MRRALTVTSLALAALVAATASAAPAAADVNGDTGGSNSGGKFTAWGAYAGATGGGNVSVTETCTLMDRPDEPAHVEYNVISYDGGATYTVWKDCVLDGEDVDDIRGLFPDGENWDILDSWEVTPVEPDDVVAEAIAMLNPTPPAIVTDPGGGIPGMVGIPTYLSFGGSLEVEPRSVTEPPITVTVWANPTGEVEWDTGDGVEACNAPPGPAGECAHLYGSSSRGQPGDEYTITARISYTGGYTVTAAGAVVGGSDDIGDIERTATTTLAVNEAQAVNTDG